MSHSGNANKSKTLASSQLSCTLCSQSESSSSRSSLNRIVTPNKKSSPSSTSAISIPSTNLCKVCKGAEDLRDMNLNEAIMKFSEKIDAYRDLTKSLNDNNSTLNHTLDTIKHFITHTEPNEVNSFFKVTNKKIDTLENSINDLSKYITKLDTIEEIVNSKIKESSPPYSPYNLDDLTSRIASLESLCTQLNTKIDSMSNRYPLQVPSASNHTTLSQTITPSAPNHLRNAPAPSPKTCIILGDSNTKYVKLEDNHLDSHRVPTYTIDDIDPNSCIGYKKIWIHVGINNLKTLNCKNINDIHGHFNTLIQKLNAIRSLCPYSKLMVSPILPTAIPTLNKRALIFNKLLFEQSNWFTTLDFNLFCGNDGKMMDIYRCNNNRRDRIHLGSLGIKILSSKAKHHLSQLDTRSYATAVRNY